MPMGATGDPVASLIRQESEFNPNAVSNKNALGLMQLLPRVGKGVAKQVSETFFSDPALHSRCEYATGNAIFPIYGRSVRGFEYALAAYNAGDDRVKDS